MTSFADRAPLDRDRLIAALAQGGVTAGRSDGWPPADLVRVVATTGSTNADVMTAARDGAPEGTVVVAAEQREGRGRLQRTWAAPPGGSLSMSLLLRPSTPATTWGWLPLLTGVAVVAALKEATGGALEPVLKWPNDVLAGSGGHKLAGILVERVESPVPSAVVGVGVNVALDRDQLPVPTATSLQLEVGLAPPREALAADLLAAVGRRYRDWTDHAGDAVDAGLHGDYIRACATLGRRVRLEQPGEDRHGTAVGIDLSGRLLLAAEDGALTAVSSGEVVHLRDAGR